MSDSQWPRFQVFEQPSDDKPFIHAGSVHAADREMALLTARDVFARRPDRVTMWVVRDSDIYARTKEELEAQPPSPDPETDAPEHAFHVFAKRTHRGVCVQIGEVHAQSVEGALAAAIQAYPLDAHVWWIFKKSVVVAADPSDQATLFDSSPGKEFRHERHFPVRTMMMDIKKRRQNE